MPWAYALVSSATKKEKFITLTTGRPVGRKGPAEGRQSEGGRKAQERGDPRTTPV